MNAAFSKIKSWREDPVLFVRELFHVEPDAWQVEALRAFADDSDPTKKRISLQACVGPGKSAVLAWCGWWFLVCQGGKGETEHPEGAVMSMTADNLKDNLWKEFAVWHGQSEFLERAFTVTAERIFANDHPKTWWLSARSWSKTANAEEQGRTLSGLHSKYILFLIDESGDTAPPVLRAAEQGLSRCLWGKIVQAGNPTSQDGILYMAAVPQRHMWTVIPITGDPDDPKRSPRIDIEWARAQIKEYGRENPWVMASILGQFPPTSINALLGIEDMNTAMRRNYQEDDFSFAQKRMGIDAAGDGADPWVIFPRQGLVAFPPVAMRNPKPSEVTARVIEGKVKWGSEMEFFDDGGGYSSGAIDGMVMAGYAPIPINFGGKATDPRYFDRRSEMLYKCAQWIKSGGQLPRQIQHAIKEFTAPTYWYEKGRFRVLGKKEIKKTLRHSTDYFDALALTFAIPDMPGATPFGHLMNQDGHHAKSEYDPFVEA